MIARGMEGGRESMDEMDSPDIRNILDGFVRTLGEEEESHGEQVTSSHMMSVTLTRKPFPDPCGPVPCAP